MHTYTEYDMDCLEELQRVISKAIAPSVARKERLVGLVWSVCAFTVSVLMLLGSWHPALVALFFVIGVFFAARVFRVYRSMARKAWMDMDKNLVRTDYAFEKAHLTATNAAGSSRYPYSNCVRLLETDERIYMILREGRGIVLDKSHISGGSPQQLRVWLESKCGKKTEQIK